MMRRFAARLRGDARGVTVTEFAIVLPVMMTLLMGMGDLLYQNYVQSVLNGAMMKAGRDSSLEQNAQTGADLDAKVAAIVKVVANQATFTSERRSYASFSLVKPETFIDTNRNGIRDPGECYDDVNGNKQWDADPGILSQGGANDVTKYTMWVTYPRLFPVAGLFGWPSNLTIRSTTLLKNQPYRTQTVAEVKQICN
jgi:hypothetical protein